MAISYNRGDKVIEVVGYSYGLKRHGLVYSDNIRDENKTTKALQNAYHWSTKMNLRHKTSEGQEMFISEMETSHLVNTISMHLRHIEHAKDTLGGGALPAWKKAMYGKASETARTRAELAIQQATVSICPYVTELALRGEQLEYLTGVLQDTFERKEKEANISFRGTEAQDTLEITYDDPEHDF